MSNIINVEEISKSFTGRKLFEKASFSVQEGEKIGIVGVNGTGKSTLLRILAGAEEADEGSVTISNYVVLNFLPQNPDFKEEHTVLEAVMDKIVVNDGDEANRWTLESEAKALLNRLKITDFSQKTSELSGGQKKRVALAATILKHCDILVLDEPTNHLDYEMIEWLEEYLRAYRGTVIMVTHDRYFLDSVCNRIVEIDRGSIYSYETNYSGFLERKVAREESQAASERKRQSILRNEIAWMQRGARARSTKQKAHIQRYEELRDQRGPQSVNHVEMASISSRMGRTTVELNGVSKAYGDKVLFSDFTYIFLKNDRVGFVGENGCGKTTLMKMIAGLTEADSGNVEIGQTIQIGYYSQEVEWMDPEQRIIDYVKDRAEFVRTSEGLVSASVMLDRFLFPPEQQYSAIGKLSGGEKRRLRLLSILMEAPNVLILDEPTNDLDTETLAILEDYLDHFDGIVITVSHDRYFLDRIVRRIFAFEGNGVVTQYEGGYTDYMAKRPEQSSSMSLTGKTGVSMQNASSDAKSGMPAGQNAGNDTTSSSPADAKATWGHEKKLKFSYKEQKEYETIESDIAALEEKIAALEKEMIANASNAGKLNALNQEKEAAEAELDAKMERWEYLEELAQKIQNQ